MVDHKHAHDAVTPEPMAGLYKTFLVKGGPPVAVRIWFGNAIIDGEEQDRGFDWRVEIDGETDQPVTDSTGCCCRVPLDVHSVWPFCARRPIDEKEYRYLQRRARWAREHAQHHPAARPRERVDVRSLKPAF
jgi:hypothetical protein